MRKFLFGAVTLAITLVLFGSALPAQASPDEVQAERDFGRKVLQKRAALGYKAFNVDTFVRELAREHSDDMARDDEVDHRGFSDRAQEALASDGRFRRVCEVVGRALGHSSVSMPSLFKRLWRNGSTADRRCLRGQLSRRDFVGIGVQRSDDTDFYYLTFISARRRGS